MGVWKYSDNWGHWDVSLSLLHLLQGVAAQRTVCFLHHRRWTLHKHDCLPHKSGAHYKRLRANLGYASCCEWFVISTWWNYHSAIVRHPEPAPLAKARLLLSHNHLDFQRFCLKKEVIRAAHSSASTPPETCVLGWNGASQNTWYPRFSSAAPYTTLPIWLHPSAPAHIRHGSTVT